MYDTTVMDSCHYTFVQTYRMYSKVKSRYWQDLALFKASRGGSFFVSSSFWQFQNPSLVAALRRSLLPFPHSCLLSLCLCPNFTLLLRILVMLDNRPTSLQYDCILTNYTCNDYIPNKSHSEVLRIRTPTYLFR